MHKLLEKLAFLCQGNDDRQVTHFWNKIRWIRL